MILRPAQPAELPMVCHLYRAVCDAMLAAGVNQWRWGEYPTEDMLREDIHRGQLYVLADLSAAVCVNQVQDEAYQQVHWLFGVKPGCFHRLAIRPDAQGKGLAKLVMAGVEEVLLSQGCDSLRIDTYAENTHAQHVYDKAGMRRAGTVHFAHRPLPFTCFEKPLTPDCPLLPLPMTPAFRGGPLTPWGGEKLATMYRKPIDQPTGESLEVSCIPGLESRDPMGVKLPELIARYGEKLVGKYAGKPFPLLLKLLDAKMPLSVQVHPNDAYAREHENALGKTEAWLILDAAEGSELVYGIRPGTDLATLRAACENSAAVEPLLRRVKVKPGDVCYLPAGCVHAIGGGILLYEIQQSSDVTYRFYDWNRVDDQGRRRQLHIEKALDVTDLTCAPDPVPAPFAPWARVLDERYFTLDLLHPLGEVALPTVQDFAMITALEGYLALRWQGVAYPLQVGETLFIPAAAPDLLLTGYGRAAVSMPK